jgi:hypothetical protein
MAQSVNLTQWRRRLRRTARAAVSVESRTAMRCNASCLLQGSPYRRTIMLKQVMKRGAALLAAVATTFVLFHSVATLADGDRAALYAAHTAATMVAAGRGSTAHN